MIILGATTATIYSIYKRLKEQKEYISDDIHEVDFPNRLQPDMFTPIKPGDFKLNPRLHNILPGDPNNPDTIKPIKPIKPTPSSREDLSREINALRIEYLDLYKRYMDNYDKNSKNWNMLSDAEVNTIKNRIDAIKARIYEIMKLIQFEPVEPAALPTAPDENTDDPETFVNFDPDETQNLDADLIKAPIQDSGILSSEVEKLAEERRWAQFSLVQPGFGLGNINQNGLALHNFLQKKKQFTNCYKNPKPFTVPTTASVERTWSPEMTPGWTPVLMNAHGDVRFQNSFDVGDPNHFTPVNPSDNKFKTFENKQSIYFPDQRLASVKAKAVAIPELRNVGGYYGTNLDPSKNGGYAKSQKIQNSMFNFSPYQPADCFENRKITKGYSNYDLPKTGSARI